MSDTKAQLEALSSVNMTASSLKFLVTEVNLAEGHFAVQDWCIFGLEIREKYPKNEK